MHIKTKTTLALVVLLALMFPVTAFAQGTDQGDKIVFAENYRLRDGETLAGNLVVFGGSVDLEDGSTVRGDLMQFGGGVDLLGEVLGSVAVLGGSLNIGDSAVIQGDLSHIGGDIQRSPEAQIRGNELGSSQPPGTYSFPFIFGSGDFLDRLPDLRGLQFLDSMDLPGFQIPRVSINRTLDFSDLASGSFLAGGVSPLEAFFRFLLQAFAYGILATLLVLFLARPAGRVQRAIVVQPFLAGGLGLVTLVVGIPVLALLAITLVLAPVSLGAFLLLVAVGIFGVVTVGMEVGTRVGHMLRRDWHPALAAGIGVFTLFLARAALWQIPCVGFLVSVIVISVGIGGVWLTRFGTRDYQHPSEGLQEET